MQSTVKRLKPLVFAFFFYAFHGGLHSAVLGEKADGVALFLINFFYLVC
jgi:hypothetical protein